MLAMPLCLTCSCSSLFYNCRHKYDGILKETYFSVLFFYSGCDEYLNLNPILSFQTNPPQQPVDLTKASSLTLSATRASSCTFNQVYSVHDYSGFQSRWRTISNRFFNLTKTSVRGKFELNVRVAVLNILIVIDLPTKITSNTKIYAV